MKEQKFMAIIIAAVVFVLVVFSVVSLTKIFWSQNQSTGISIDQKIEKANSIVRENSKTSGQPNPQKEAVPEEKEAGDVVPY